MMCSCGVLQGDVRRGGVLKDGAHEEGAARSSDMPHTRGDFE